MRSQKKVAWLIGASPQGMGGAITRMLALDTGEWRDIVLVISDLPQQENDVRLLLTEAVLYSPEAYRPSMIGKTGLWMPLDVTDYDAVYKTANDIVSRFGKIDVLINTAGIMPQSNFGLLARMKPEDLRRMGKSMAVNFWGALASVAAVLPHMQKAGYGRIVLFSSVAGSRAERGNAVYAAAKAAVESLTKTAAVEAPFNSITKEPADIRVNAVAPGITLTPMITGVVSDKAQEAYLRDNPAHAFTTPQEVAWAVLQLASKNASGINGMTIAVDKGHVVRGT